MLTWSYDSLVPSYRLSRETRNVLRVSDARYIAITDPEMMVYKELSDGIPGFIQVCITATHSIYCNILFSLPHAATRCNTLQHAVWDAPYIAIPPTNHGVQGVVRWHQIPGLFRRVSLQHIQNTASFLTWNNLRSWCARHS